MARAERDVRHREEKIERVSKYKEFLDALTPKEWFDEPGEDASEMYYSGTRTVARRVFGARGTKFVFFDSTSPARRRRRAREI